MKRDETPPTPEELLLDAIQAVRRARKGGPTALADLRFASDCLRQVEEQLEELSIETDAGLNSGCGPESDDA